MAFTDAEETKLRAIMTAFDTGEQVDDLPLGSNDVQDKSIEVFNSRTGESERMPLREAVTMASAPYFERVWNTAVSTPKAATWGGSLSMGQNLPDILKLGCYLVKNDHSRRKLDPTNHYRFANGETAKLDGSMGHYQWGWGVKWYVAFWLAGGLFHEAISLTPIPGQYNYVIPVGSLSAHGFASLERDTQTLVSYINDDPNYRGGQNHSDRDGTYRSELGMAVTGMTCENMRKAARKNGTGWLCGTMRHNAAVKILFEVIFGTRNIQDAFNAARDSDGLYQGGLGNGVSTWNGTAWNNHNGYNPFLPTSVGVELGDSCGVVNYEVKGEDGATIYTAPVPVFFGLKNAFAYLWRHQDDEFGKVNEDTSITHLVAPSIYGTWTIGVETGMVAYSTSPTQGSSYIKVLSYDNLEIWPTETGGSASTYHCDYFWNISGATSGFRLVLRGCHASNGAYAGSAVVYVLNAVSYSYAYIGSPLCEAEEEWPVEPVYAQAA
ncbi:MAG: hypothetical protein IJ604_08760 [Prevotella sp.]|nr:hypothetical protein [Prevotella sp.]